MIKFIEVCKCEIYFYMIFHKCLESVLIVIILSFLKMMKYELKAFDITLHSFLCYLCTAVIFITDTLGPFCFYTSFQNIDRTSIHYKPPCATNVFHFSGLH